MGSFTNDELAILYKLWRNRCFGKGHLLIDNLVDSFPTDTQKNIKISVNNLIKNRNLLKKPTKHGQAVFINLAYRKQIEIELKKKYPFL